MEQSCHSKIAMELMLEKGQTVASWVVHKILKVAMPLQEVDFTKANLTSMENYNISQMCAQRRGRMEKI
ncbi:hypothetical protein H5410_037203 [Solanum commersonii]|uniref:Uncharacterized protein n=1 Tax=Solanum commersonii TaxID=4109 RepID=A0A9J5Y5L9_SOLCO|nr:hypothetical protein H5410_037203 [Solanum commersonii]